MSDGYSSHRAEMERGHRPAPADPHVRPANRAPKVFSFADARATLGLRRIMAVTAEAFDLAPEQIMQASNTFAIAHPRQAGMHLVRKMTKHSLPKIGAMLSLDHATVLYGIRATERRLQTNTDFAARYAKAETRLVQEAFLRRIGPVAISQYAMAMEIVAVEANWPLTETLARE